MKTCSPSTSWVPPEGSDPLSFRVTTFTGPACAGAHHHVIVNPSPTQKRRALDAALEDEIVAFVHLAAEEVGAKFFQAGYEIKRCGSGIVAVAHVLHHEMGLPLKDLKTAGGTLNLQRKENRLGYRSTALPLQRIEDDCLWRALVDQQLLNCFLVGGDADYALLELANESALAKTTVDLQALTQSTKRALILTAVADTKPFNYVLRYFAPQYGLTEGAVTASVNAELGCFWSRRLKRSLLIGRQVSPQGALFEVLVEGSHVWVMGEAQRGDA